MCLKEKETLNFKVSKASAKLSIANVTVKMLLYLKH